MWHLSVAADQESDGMCAIYAALYRRDQQLNLRAFWDPRHGFWRDNQLCARSLGLTSWLMLRMVTMSLRMGRIRQIIATDKSKQQ